MLWIELVGWGGSLLVLLAYALLSTGHIGAASRLYQGMNILGASGMAANGWAHGALPSVFNNVVWIGIGCAAIAGLRRSRPADAAAGSLTGESEAGPVLSANKDAAGKIS